MSDDTASDLDDEIRTAVGEVDVLRDAVDALDPSDPAASDEALRSLLATSRSLTTRVERSILPAVRATGDPGESLADREVGLHTELDRVVARLRSMRLDEDVDAAAWHRRSEELRETLDATVEQLALLDARRGRGASRRPSTRPHTSPPGRHRA